MEGLKNAVMDRCSLIAHFRLSTEFKVCNNMYVREGLASQGGYIIELERCMKPGGSMALRR